LLVEQQKESGKHAVKNWRADFPVLVTEAHTIGSLAVIRSLGRAGYPVIASSPQPDALGFYSRHCHKPCVQPAYEHTGEFTAWLDRVLTSESISLIIPSESFLVAIRQRFAATHHLLPVPDEEKLVYSALSKYDLFHSFSSGELDEHLPPFILLGEEDSPPSPEQFHKLGTPLFLKVDAVHSRDGGDGGLVVKCDTVEAALEKIHLLRERYRNILIQGFVPGVGVGVFLGRWKGQVLGEFMHRRIHEVPHWGGVSSFRESWKHEKIMKDARMRADHLNWDGVGMFEYRWNPDNDRFYLMEFNSRFWGSLHLALFAGVDFPRLLADAMLGHPSPPVVGYPSVRCRLTFPREVEYVFSRLKDSSLSVAQRLWTVLEFIWLGLDPRVRSDLSFAGDRMLYWRMMIRSIRRFMS
jgi:hypothetical protein